MNQGTRVEHGPMEHAPARPGLHRRLYDWVLHWAETPYAIWALALLALAESSFFPIPPDVLLIAMCLGARERAWKFAAICSVASRWLN